MYIVKVGLLESESAYVFKLQGIWDKTVYKKYPMTESYVVPPESWSREKLISEIMKYCQKKRKLGKENFRRVQHTDYYWKGWNRYILIEEIPGWRLKVQEEA